jgi:CRP-like cAMP-binding protein
MSLVLEEAVHHPTQNQLLAALPAEDLARLMPDLELVKLPLGKVIYSSGEQLRYAWFPTTATVSLHCDLESGDSSEIAGVGNEGLVGILLLMGGDSTSSAATVQVAGYAYRLKTSLLQEEFERGGFAQRLLLRYTQAIITEISQTAACNKHHSVYQRLCRWLLLTLDRTPSNDLVMTQELVAFMLGVRREGITEAAGLLRNAGVISYNRGHIKVVQRKGLEEGACECYQVVRSELDRLYSQTV